MQHLNFKEFYEQLERVLASSTSFEESMREMLRWGAVHYPHDTWNQLAALDLSAEIGRVQPWIMRVLRRDPSPFPVKGIYFGLSERNTKSKVEYADIYFALMGQCDFADKKSKWLWGPLRHYPRSAYLRSDPLKAAGLICNEDEERGLSTPGYLIFSLSFSALLLRHSLNSSIFDLLEATEPLGVVFGFDSGDQNRLGRLEANGLSLNEESLCCWPAFL